DPRRRFPAQLPLNISCEGKEWWAGGRHLSNAPNVQSKMIFDVAARSLRQDLVPPHLHPVWASQRFLATRRIFLAHSTTRLRECLGAKPRVTVKSESGVRQSGGLRSFAQHTW